MISEMIFDTDPGSRVDRHTTDMGRCDTRRSSDSDFDTTAPQPLDVLIDDIGLATPRLSGEKNIASRFEDIESEGLVHIKFIRFIKL